MICPRCGGATLKKVLFKVDGKEGFHCDDCDRLWFEEERMTATNGHAMSGFRKDDKEYTLERITEEDSDDEEAMYPKFV